MVHGNVNIKWVCSLGKIGPKFRTKFLYTTVHNAYIRRII
jgi:hypothetical protein